MRITFSLQTNARGIPFVEQGYFVVDECPAEFALVVALLEQFFLKRVFIAQFGTALVEL